MKRNAKRAIAVLLSILGTVLGLYIGGYLLFARPVYMLVTSFTSGTLTARGLITNILMIFIASTVGGAIWCLCDILAGIFRDEPRDD